ncbi:MAG: hypothetical protein MJK12_05980 [Colwellia sp.]|nr:hypothetical protein [Colwellia sp.]
MSPPALKTKVEIINSIEEGIQLLDGIYKNTIVTYDVEKADEAGNEKSAETIHMAALHISKPIFMLLSNQKR